MRAVDDVILATLRAADVDVHDGLVTATADKVVTYDLPYAVFASSIGDDHSPRLTGRTTRRAVFFSLMYVGVDRNQAKALGERIRNVLESRRLPFTGRSWLVELLDSQRVRRDDDAIRPDGSPLFYGVDNYSVSVTRTVTAQEATP